MVNGSKLTIRWPGTRIVDWSPKSIPPNVIQPWLDEPIVVTYTLKGDQLVTDRKDVFQRLK
jgi:hypothetical protein